MKKAAQADYRIGIDEAGRGPLAGPVSIGAVKLGKAFNTKLLTTLRGKDSKKLSEKDREIWFTSIKEWKKNGHLDFHVALVSHTIIDQYGISYAIKKGIKECLRKVKADGEVTLILLDGSLKAPEEFLNQKTIIKGDEKETIIGLASIAAKVTRDAYMKRIARKYPLYNFEVHKGYGTRNHSENIKKYGLSEIHRKTFCHF
jgi:ribonuclease HII